MNFYKHHIGDYDADTAHLSWLEDMAYTRLMRLYYRREAAIPSDLNQACRLVRAASKQERDAVASVLNEFFCLEEDGWHNKRCDEEIADAQDKQTGEKSKKENEAERQRRHRARRKELFDELRGHGLVPGYDTQTSELETMLSRVTGALHTKPATRDATANQTPDARHQTPDIDSTNVELSPEPDKPDSGDDPPGVPKCPVKRIVALYHEVLPELAPVHELPEATVRMMRARWRSSPERQDVSWWRDYFDYVKKCGFLMGRKTEFQADLLWLVRPTNFAKVLNGKYEDRA